MEIQQKKAVRPADDFIRIQDLWSLFVPRWGWFVISLVLCLGASALYLAVTPNVYTRYAELLVKDDGNKSGGVTSISSEFSDLGIFGTSSNISNELTTLKSPELMTEVVRRLRLNENYSKRDGMKTVTLYGSQPVNVYFKGKPSTSFSMDIKLTSPTDFIITSFSSGDIDGMTFEGKLGQGIKTPIGTIALSRSSYYKEGMIGMPFRYSHGSVDAFAEMMNEEALTLGATNSHFINPHGLPDDNHYTTAYDMYLIMNAAVKYSLFNEIIQMDSYTTVYHDKNGAEKEVSVNNTNYYIQGTATAPGGITVIGGKTGTTNAAGHCLILLSRDTSSKPYISIIMRAEDKDALYGQMTDLLGEINN